MLQILLMSFLGVAFADFPAEYRTICDGVDTRVLTQDPYVARTFMNIDDRHPCSASLIGNSCMISAGHCHRSLNMVEFNVPESVNGHITRPKPEDVYMMVPGSLVYQQSGDGKDWSVFKVQPNVITGLTPAEAQGGFLSIDTTRQRRGTALQITGFGKDREPNTHNAQQTSYGSLAYGWGSTIYYRVDTTGGNSGSGIRNKQTQKIIGVHTHGGCYTGSDTYNHGTSLAGNRQLQNAIQRCLQSQ